MTRIVVWVKFLNTFIWVLIKVTLKSHLNSLLSLVEMRGKIKIVKCLYRNHLGDNNFWYFVIYIYKYHEFQLGIHINLYKQIKNIYYNKILWLLILIKLWEKNRKNNRKNNEKKS